MLKRKNKAPYISAVFGGIVILLAAGFGIWLAVTDAATKVKAPTRPIPNPNAYDYYVDAAGKMVNENEVSDAISHYKPPTSAAKLPPLSPELRAALKSYGASGTPQMPPPPRKYSLSEKKALIKANEPALQSLREGFKYECLCPQLDPTIAFRKYVTLRELARLTSLDCQVCSESGEHGKAMQSCLDGIQLGGDTIKGSEIMGFLISISIQAIAIHEATPDLIGNLNATEAQSAVTRLDKILAKYTPFSEILKNEKFSGIQRLQSPVYYSPPGTMAPRVGTTTSLFNRIMLPGHITDWDKTIADTAIPYPQYSKLPPQSGSILFRIIAPVISKARLRYEHTLCNNHMLLLQLVLRSYKATTGAYPSKLTDLTPKYLAKLPPDRFAPSGTYKYKQTAKGYILYSIGPDGKDNAGIPVTVRGTPEPKDRGDIVVEHIK